MNQSDKVRELAIKYDEEHKVSGEDLHVRFKTLVDQYGASLVSAATGLRESSVLVYARTKNPSLSEYSVVKAEEILKSL